MFAIASPRRWTPLPWYRRPHPLHQVGKNALQFRLLAPSLGEARFNIAQSEADVLAEPNASDSPGALLGADPAFRNAQALSKLARGQQLFCITPAFAVVCANPAGVALGQEARRKVRQDRGDLVYRHAPSPVHNRRIDPLLHQCPGLAVDQLWIQAQNRKALERNRQVFGRNLDAVSHAAQLLAGNERGSGAQEGVIDEVA
jgi:hypothetical protein